MIHSSRRSVLRTATLAAAAGGAAAAAGVWMPAWASDARDARGTPPLPRQRVTTYVFVAGANGSSGGSNELTLRGHRTVGVDLPGHGMDAAQFHASYQAPQDLEQLAHEPSPVAGVTLDDYVRATIAVVRRAAAHGPVILVGGSMGGATLNRVGSAVPRLISRIVYDSAFCCVDLASPADYLQTPEGSTTLLLDIASGAVGDPTELGASRINWRSADPDFLAKAKAAFLADGTDAEFFALLNYLQPDEAAGIPLEDARVDARTWGRIPRTFIRHTKDRAIPIALQDRMIAEADALTPHNRFDVRTVETSHVPTVAKFGEIVDILDGLA